MSRHHGVNFAIGASAFAIGYGAPFLTDAVGDKTVVIILLAIPWLVIAVVALRGETLALFPRSGDNAHHAVLWPLIVFPTIGIFGIAETPNAGPPGQRLFLMTFAMAPAVTGVWAALCREVRSGRRALALTLLMAVPYAFEALVAVNSVFDHAEPETELAKIEAVFVSGDYGPSGQRDNRTYFQLRYLHGDGEFRWAAPPRWAKQRGDIICVLSHPGAVGLDWTSLIECPPSAFENRRQELREYGATYVRAVLRMGEITDRDLERRVLSRLEAELASIGGTESLLRIEKTAHRAFNAEGFRIE